MCMYNTRIIRLTENRCHQSQGLWDFMRMDHLIMAIKKICYLWGLILTTQLSDHRNVHYK